MQIIAAIGLMLVLCSNSYGANENLPPLPSTQPAKFLYLENVPQNTQKITFELEKHCASSQSPIDIQDFISQKEYLSVDAKKMKPVRVVHVYARSNQQNCKKFVSKKISKTLEIPAASSMTHVYITADPELIVRSVQ